MIQQIRKRDGSIVEFIPGKIARAIYKAVAACGGKDYKRAEVLADQVVKIAAEKFGGGIPTVEDIQDIVEKVLIENGHAKTAKAYILYREKRKGTRNMDDLVDANADVFSNYLGDRDWKIKESSNMTKSINGLNNYIKEAFVANYWLHEIYPEGIRKAHEKCDLHIHDGASDSLLCGLGFTETSLGRHG